MDKLLPTIGIAAIVVLVFLAMWWGWRRRSRRDEALRPVTVLPSELGTQLAEATVFYVSTTKHDNAIERLAIRGLGFRGRATMTVFEAGAVLSIAGENPVFIASERLEWVGQATWTIDRVVEQDGLIRIAWAITAADPASAAPTIVDSFLRVIDPDERKPLIDALRSIAQHQIESEV